MTDIVAGDVTYSFKNRDKMYLGRRGFSARGTITFGNGSLTYPSGGIPLTKGSMGLPRVLRSLKVLESNAKGYTFEHDVSAETLRMFFSGAGTIANANVTGTASAPTITLGNAAGNIVANAVIGVNALANAAALQGSIAMSGVTGVQAPTLTMNVHTHTGTAAVFAELSGGSTAVVSSVVCEVEAEGY